MRIVRLIAVLLALGLLCVTGCSPKTEDEPAPPSAETAPPQNTAGLQMGVPLEQGDGRVQEAQELADMEYAVLEDRIVGLFRDNDDVRRMFAETANALYAAVPDTLNKFLMIVPSRIEFETEDVRAYADAQDSAIEKLYFIVDNSVTKVDAYSVIASHAAEEPLNDLFFRLDHHWTALGAYYAAQSFFDTAGIAYHDIGQYEVKKGDPFWGYLYAVAGETSLLDKPDTLTYYQLPGSPKTETLFSPDETGALKERKDDVVKGARGGYATFMGPTSFAYAVLNGTPESERSLLIVADSLVCAFATWMADNFKTVVVIDPRYFELGREGFDRLFSDYGITDFLILDDANVSTSSPWFISKMQGLLK